MKIPEQENVKCDLIHIDEECLKQVTEYTELCKKISDKKTKYEKVFEEITSLSKTLKIEILNLSFLENKNKEHFIKKNDSDEKTLAILADNIKQCKESMAIKLPVSSSPLLSPILSALQVNCYLITINFQSLLTIAFSHPV